MMWRSGRLLQHSAHIAPRWLLVVAGDGRRAGEREDAGEMKAGEVGGESGERANVQFVRHARNRRGGAAERPVRTSGSLQTGGGGGDAVGEERARRREQATRWRVPASESIRRRTHSSLSQALSYRHLPSSFHREHTPMKYTKRRKY
jgi:hypothetical protein